MPKVTRLNGPEVGDAVDSLKDIAGDIRSALAELTRAAHELAGCWGDDDFGRTFAQGYVPFAEAFTDNCYQLADLAKGESRNLGQIRRLYDDMDADAAGILELKDS